MGASQRDLYAIARTKELFESLKWDELEYICRPESSQTNKAGQVLAQSLILIDDALRERGMGVSGEDWGKLVVSAGLAIIAANRDKQARERAN